MKAILAAILFASFGSHAAVTFTKVADSATAAPGGVGTFVTFTNVNANSGRIAFIATEPTASAGAQKGVFVLENGTLRRLFDQSAIVPNASGSFTNMSGLVMKGEVIAIAGGEVGRTGIYRYETNQLSKWIDTTHDFPNGVGISAFQGFSTDGNQLGVYATAPTYRFVLIVDKDGTMATSYDASKFSVSPVLLGFDAGTAFSFLSSPATGAVMMAIDSPTPRHVLTWQTPVPGRTERFTGFRNPPVAAEGKVVFHASYVGGSGLFIVNQDGSGLARLVDSSMTAPSGGTFASFSDFIYSAGTLVFNAVSVGVTRMFRLQNGTIDLLLSPGGTVDEKKVTTVALTGFGLHNGLLAFAVAFEGGTTGVYTANVGTVTPPEIKLEPSSAQFANGRFTFTFAGVPGKTYRIEHSTDLPFTAQNAMTLTTITFSAPVTIVDENASGATRYYRAVEQ